MVEEKYIVLMDTTRHTKKMCMIGTEESNNESMRNVLDPMICEKNK